jgi:urate oxidase
MKISREEYAKFLEHLAWQRLQSPDYRLGQAFLNYFPQISKHLIESEQWGTLYEYNLFNEINDLQAQKIIDLWLDR